MTVTIPPELESALTESARSRGQTPETTAIQFLRERLLPTKAAIVPRDDWERRILSMGQDCGVSLSNEALSREAIYDE